MQRRVHLLAVVLVTVAASVPTSPGPASANAAAREVAPSADLDRRLGSFGVDLSAAVLQRGLRNYVGANCPGTGWTCSDTNRPVVQIAHLGTAARNVGECAPGANECVIVQIGTAGENQAECIEETDQPEGLVSQSCEIIQVNVLGTNTALVRQTIRQDATGTEQVAEQTATLVQENGSGANALTTVQEISQSARNRIAGGSIDQNQQSHQFTSVDQDTTTGTNSSDVEQVLVQFVAANSRTSVEPGSAVQKQNASDAGPNTQARIDQRSNSTDGGTNTSHLLQENRLQAEAAAGSIHQTQGSLIGGLEGFVAQFSSGLSSSVNRQIEVQLANAEGEFVSQTQHGPATCCTTQFNNPDNIFDIVQTSTQTASNPDALQTNELRGSCITSGICTIDQTVIQNGAVTTNGCAGAACFPFTVCPPPTGTPAEPCATGIRRVSWNRPPQ